MDILKHAAGTAFLSFIIVFTLDQVFAQEVSPTVLSRTFNGKVIDTTTGQPVFEAIVSVAGRNTIVACNQHGMFSITIPAETVCTLTVKKPGYEETNIPVEPGITSAPSRIILNPLSVHELPKLIINTTRTRLPITTTARISQISISPELAAKLPSVGQADIFRSLQLLPGVGGTNESSSGLYVRGGTPDQNLIILNGMPIYYVDHFYGFFSAFNPKAINNVTLHKGGFSSRWGGRLSSVVELSSSNNGMSSDSQGIKVDVGTGLLSSSGFLQIPLKNSDVGTLMFAGRRSMTDFYRTDLFNKLFNRMHGTDTMSTRTTDGKYYEDAERLVYQPEFMFWDINGLATFKIGSRGKLATTFFTSRDYQDNSIDTTWAVRNSIPVTTITYLPGDKKQYTIDTLRIDTITKTTVIKNKSPVFWGNICIGQQWKEQWSDVYTTGLNLSYSQFLDTKTEDYFRSDSKTERFSDMTSPIDSIFEAVSWMASTNKITDISGRFDNTITISDWNRLNTGVELSRKNVIYMRDTMPTDTNSMEWKRMLVWEQPTPIRRNDTSISMAGYAEDELRFGDKAGLTPGLRFYYFSLTSAYALDPRVSGWWQLFPEVKVQGSWGLYTQEIHRAEQEDISGGGKYIWLMTNADLPFEKSQQIIGGISWEKRHFILDIEGYVKRMSGLLTISERMRTVTTSRTGQPFNPNELALFEGTGFARGLELLAQIRNVHFPLASKNATYNGWVSYTWSRMENTYAAFNNGNPFPASNDHTHEVKVVNIFEWNVATWSSINIGAVWLYSTGTPYTAPLGVYTLVLLDSTLNRSYMQVSDKNAFRLPDYHRLDLSVAWNVRFGRHVKGSLTMGLFNAYRQENILERTYSSSTIGDNGGEIMSGNETMIFTAMDKNAMLIMPNAGMELTVEF